MCAVPRENLRGGEGDATGTEWRGAAVEALDLGRVRGERERIGLVLLRVQRNRTAVRP
jgi:hypothetical protein